MNIFKLMSSCYHLQDFDNKYYSRNRPFLLMYVCFPKKNKQLLFYKKYFYF